MTYNTPELLLAGAAQNLVLGIEPIKGVGQNHDDATSAHPAYSLFADLESEW